MISLDDDACCQFLRRLVEIHSLSGQESAAVQFLVNKMQEWGLTASVDAAGSAVGVRETATSRCTILLLGHIDTVPGEIETRIEDGILFGRGSVDAKGPLATFTTAAAQAQLPPTVRLVVAGAVEEESATSRGARQIAKDFQPDYCIIGEPSSASAITLGYKGRLLVNYKISVDEGHSAGPNPSAAELAANFWQQISQYANQFNDSRDRLFDQLLPSLRTINSHADGLTGTATAKIGCRLPPDFDAQRFTERLKEFSPGAEVETFGYEAAHQSGRSGPLVSALAGAIRKQQLTPKYKLKTGTSDMNVVAPIWKCPIVAYGPGDSSLDHTPHEHLHLDEYLQSIAILTDAIETLARSM